MHHLLETLLNLLEAQPEQLLRWLCLGLLLTGAAYFLLASVCLNVQKRQQELLVEQERQQRLEELLTESDHHLHI